MTVEEKNSVVCFNDRKTVLAKVLQVHRKRHNYSIARLSRESGVNSTTIYYCENHSNIFRHIFTADDCIALSNTLKIDSDVLFEESLRNRIKYYVKKSYDRYNKFEENGKPTCLPRFVSHIKYDSYDYDFSELGNILRSKREEIGFTKRKFAKISRVKYRWLCDLERGIIRPTFPLLRKVCDKLRINMRPIVRCFVKESVELWEDIYREEYRAKKEGNDRKVRQKKERFCFKQTPMKYNTITRDYLFQKRCDQNISTSDLVKKYHISPSVLMNYCSGESTFNFKHILFFADLFGDNPNDLFNMCLRDSEYLYLIRVEKKFDQFIKTKMASKINSFSFINHDMRTKDYISPFFLKSSSYLIKMREKKGLLISEISCKIGINWVSYKHFETGKNSMSFLLMSACEKIYGIDIKELYKMVIDERVEVWKSIHKETWRRLKHKKL